MLEIFLAIGVLVTLVIISKFAVGPRIRINPRPKPSGERPTKRIRTHPKLQGVYRGGSGDFDPSNPPRESGVPTWPTAQDRQKPQPLTDEQCRQIADYLGIELKDDNG